MMSSCAGTFHTANASKDKRPLLFQNEYDIKTISEVNSTGKAFWGIPYGNGKYRRNKGSLGPNFRINGVALSRITIPNILPILTLLSCDFALAISMQGLSGRKTERYYNSDGYSIKVDDGPKMGIVTALLLSFPIAGTLNNFVWSGAKQEASLSIQRELIDQNPDIDLFFFPKYKIKKYDVFNDGIKYLWFQKADINVKVKGATIKVTE